MELLRFVCITIHSSTAISLGTTTEGYYKMPITFITKPMTEFMFLEMDIVEVVHRTKRKQSDFQRPTNNGTSTTPTVRNWREQTNVERRQV